MNTAAVTGWPDFQDALRYETLAMMQTRSVPAGITGTTNQEKTVNKKTASPKYLPPVKALIIECPKDLAKLTKDKLVENLTEFYQENNELARDLANHQTQVNNLKVDLKEAKKALKVLKADVVAKVSA